MKLPLAPLAITMDPATRKIYWATGTGITEAGYDGRNEREILSLPGSLTTDIAIDARGGKMYLTDARDNEVRRANLDGSGYEVLMTGVDHAENIALYLCAP